MAAQGQMSCEQVKSTVKALETSPSKSQASSPIYGKGKNVGKGTKMPASKKGIS